MSGRRPEHHDDMSDRLEGGDGEEAAFDEFAIDEQVALSSGRREQDEARMKPSRQVASPMYWVY